ncbi:hypothetical protein AB3N02_22710 [Priestia aryabhattai]|uniref:hypothetical protein n=1 Tax=Priestia aryabhattai TaxID=412384 RepID=UPI0039A2E6A8
MNMENILPSFRVTKSVKKSEVVSMTKTTGKKSEQILNALRTAGDNGITNVELSKIALRYGGYLGTLYKQGFKVQTTHLGDGVFNYVLYHEPEVIVERESAIEVLLKAIDGKGAVTKEELLNIFSNHNIAVKYKANTYKLS